MSGSKNVTTAKITVQEILQMTLRGGLSQRKWSSNSKELLQSIPEELRSSHTSKDKKPTESEHSKQKTVHADQSITDITNSIFSSEESVKCLGILWDTDCDNFMFRIDVPEPPETDTKRRVLSEIAWDGSLQSSSLQRFTCSHCGRSNKTGTLHSHCSFSKPGWTSSKTSLTSETSELQGV
jgi:hypothetical protein